MTAFYIFCTAFALYATFAILNDDKRYENEFKDVKWIPILIAIIPMINIPFSIVGFMILLSESRH